MELLQSRTKPIPCKLQCILDIWWFFLQSYGVTSVLCQANFMSIQRSPCINGLASNCSCHKYRRHPKDGYEFGGSCIKWPWSLHFFTYFALIALKIIKDVFTFWIIYPIRCLSYTANAMPADTVALLGARASAGMELKPEYSVPGIRWVNNQTIQDSVIIKVNIVSGNDPVHWSYVHC